MEVLGQDVLVEGPEVENGLERPVFLGDETEEGVHSLATLV